MNVKEYISSGMLELYVLGQLSEAEEREVLTMAQEHPEVRAELDEIERTLERYAQHHAIEPPREVLENIMRMTKENGGAGPDKSGGAPGWLPWLLGALALIAVIGLIWSLDRASHFEEQLAGSEAAIDSLEEAVEHCDSLDRQLQLIRNVPSEHRIFLEGTENFPESRAVVYYDSARNESLMDILHLPTPEPGKQYQLWAIVDGQPTDMGVFEWDPDSPLLINVPFVENAQAFAVTLEDAGGSPTPTMDQMYMIGQVGSG